MTRPRITHKLDWLPISLALWVIIAYGAAAMWGGHG